MGSIHKSFQTKPDIWIISFICIFITFFYFIHNKLRNPYCIIEDIDTIHKADKLSGYKKLYLVVLITAFSAIDCKSSKTLDHHYKLFTNRMV